MQQHIPAGDAYFVTIIAHERRRVFQTDKSAQLFVETILDYQTRGIFDLHAFVVMPDHVHILLSPRGIAFERAVGMIKGAFSRKLKSKFPVWQSSYRDRRCRDAGEFAAFRDYIHLNPVRARMTDNPAHYRYSSAFQGAVIASG